MLKNSAKKYLQNIRAPDRNLRGNFNAGIEISEEKRDCGSLSIWVIEHGTSSIISMGLLEKERYRISYETGGTWIVTTPAWKTMKFMRGTGAYYGMPYIDMINNTHVVNMLQTFRINYEGYTKK